jgi:hypothetical protein
MRRCSEAILICLFSGLCAFSQDSKAKGFFEWGEYDSLLVAVGRYFASSPDAPDSGIACRLYSYAGVAYFAKGDIAEARRQFESALKCDTSLTIDAHYVTPEMINLFSATKNELEQQRLYGRLQDSLQTARETEPVENEQEQSRRQSLRSTIRNAWLGAGAGYLCCLAFGGLAGYEYVTGQSDQRHMDEAAASGDHTAYENYRTLVLRRNGLAIGFTAASVLAGGVGVYFTVHGIGLKKTKFSVSAKGGGPAISISRDF